MMPVGYMAKHVSQRPDWLKALQVRNIYSVSNCISEDFADYIKFWQHNGYWFFDTPETIRAVARENSIRLQPTSLFYYEAYEVEFDGKRWRPYAPVSGVETNIVPAREKQLEGFDIVTFTAENAPECSPLSCNGLAEHMPTNEHCLLNSFKEAEAGIESDLLLHQGEPGPWRIFAVYSLDWPAR